MTIGNLRSGSRVKGKRMPYKGREHPRRPCTSCGKLTEVEDMEYGMCTPCLKSAAPRPPNEAQSPKNYFRILASPDETIRPSAKFLHLHFTLGLRDGIWPPGLIVRRPNSVVAAVHGETGRPQWLGLPTEGP
jgi:hypothetical protein